MKDKQGVFPRVEKERAIPVLIDEVTPVSHDLQDLMRLTDRLRPLAMRACRRATSIPFEEAHD